MTGKQERFVAEYLIDLNATQAAIRAGYSPKVAGQQGFENLKKPEIAEAISKGKARQLNDADLSAVRTLQELKHVAYSDIGDIFNDAGQLQMIKSLPREVRAVISSVKVVKKNLVTGDGVMDDIHEVKIWDKMKAIEMAMKHFGLLAEKVDHSGEVSMRWLEPAERS